MTPAGSRLFPRRSAAAAPASMVSVPFGSSEPAIHFLREVTGLPGARNQVARRAGFDRVQRIVDVAGGDHHVGAGGGGDLAGLDLGAHAAAGMVGGGLARHRLDLGGDARHERRCAWPWR